MRAEKKLFLIAASSFTKIDNLMARREREIDCEDFFHKEEPTSVTRIRQRLGLLAVGAMLSVITGGVMAEEVRFSPLEQWRSAVLAGNAEALRGMYSSDPAAQIRANSATMDAEEDIRFWTGLKAQAMQLNIVRAVGKDDKAQVIFNAKVESGAGGKKSLTVSDDQVWQRQGDQWRIVFVTRVDDPHLQQPESMNKELYPEKADAPAEVREALAKAQADHKRVLLVVGANWCYDCHVLDLAFQRPDIAPLLEASYEVVHVDIGDGTKNADLLARYELTTKKGIPVLGVLDGDGHIVVSQKNGEFENARALTPEELAAFLKKWKAK